MPSDMENRTMELLTTVVEDEQKSITYRWLSRSMGVSVNIAKQFMESYLATVGQGKAYGTYYVARQEAGTGNRAISLVTQEELEAIKNDEAVIGYHIYSVQPSPLKDLAILSVSNFEASQLQQGKDLNTYRVIHNPHVIVSKSNVRPGVAAAAAAPSTSASIAAKAAAASTPGLSGTKPGLTSTSSLSNTSLAPKSTTTTATTATSTNGTDSSTTHSKTKPASGSKPSMMSFFGKAATTAATAPKKSPTVSAATSTTTTTTTTPSKKPSSTLNFKPAAQPQKRKADSMLATTSNPTASAADQPQESEDDEEEVDSEEERDRRLALSSRLDQDQGDVVNGAGNHPTQSSKKEALNLDADAIKKRQRSARRLAIDDDDDDDEDDDGENENVDHDFAGSKKSAPVDMEEDEESVEVLTKEARAALNLEKEAQRLALENMMLMDDTTADLDKDEDSPMIDVEALDPNEDSSALASIPSSTTETVTRDGVVVRRRRGVRAVTKRKTSRNERGYMVTEDVVVMEPFSEDEIIQPPTPARAPVPVRAAKPAEPTKGKTEAAPKKKAGSGNQSLLNFFSKK